MFGALAQIADPDMSDMITAIAGAIVAIFSYFGGKKKGRKEGGREG